MSKQRILLIGASGIIGQAVHKLIHDEFTVLTAGLNNADVVMDLSKPKSMTDTLLKLGTLDHIISTAGRAHFVRLENIAVADLKESQYGLGIVDKLMGQVNLALVAREVLSEKGSITLTSGTTSTQPIIGGSSLSMVNGALEAWVKAAATEMPKGIRLNTVSPSLAEETPEPGFSAFPGFQPIPAKNIALAYLRCIKSLITGQTINI